MASMQNVIANIVDRGNVRKIRVRGVPGERAFPLAHVGAEHEAGVVQFAAVARGRALFRAQHPEFQAVDAPVGLVKVILLVGGVEPSSLFFEVVAMAVEFLPFLRCDALVAVSPFVWTIDVSGSPISDTQ